MKKRKKKEEKTTQTVLQHIRSAVLDFNILIQRPFAVM